jgi:hypothetical protein
MGGSSSAVSDALTAAPPSPVVESCRDDRLLSAAALSLSKHEVAATLATASPDGAPAAVADREDVAVRAPADFCAVGRVQQSHAAHDAAGARPSRQSASPCGQAPPADRTATPRWVGLWLVDADAEAPPTEPATPHTACATTQPLLTTGRAHCCSRRRASVWTLEPAWWCSSSAAALLVPLPRAERR